MRSLKAEESLVSLATFKNMFKTWKLSVKSKDKIATQEKQTRQQFVVDKDQDISDNAVMLQTIISRSSKSIGTSQSKVLQNNQNSCLRLEERIVHRKLSLPSGKVEQELFYSRCVDVSSSETNLNLFDLYQERHIQEKITFSQFELVYNLNDHSDTRLVDGLLTTTLCSTEL